MNTTEKIVESYYRICRNCFTISDVKVVGGNNRQLDLVAYEIESKRQYHIEVGVTHARGFQPNVDKLEKRILQKFFGEPRPEPARKKKRSSPKNYLAQVIATYRSLGFEPKRVERVWVCWERRHTEELQQRIHKYCQANELNECEVQFVSFRDTVMPQLMKEVSTSHYGDDALRTFSLLRASERQNRARAQRDSQSRLND